MIKKIRIVLVIVFLFSQGRIYAAQDEIQADAVASVVVGTAFSLNLDKTSLDFGLLNPGERIELYSAGYYHQLTGLSNNKKNWVLKIAMPADFAGPGGALMSKASFKWQLFWTNGSGIKKEGWEGLGDDPQVIYTSGPADSQGEEIYIQLRYALDVPENIPSGNYSTILVYTMTETI